MAEQFSVVTQSVVSVTVTSTANAFGAEKRFQKDLSIAALKVLTCLLHVYQYYYKFTDFLYVKV